MPLPAPIVGIIANPASGRDLRRLTANAGLYSSTDKASAIQRLLAAFGATGIGQVLLPSDMTGIAAAVLKASQGPGARDQHWPAIEILDLPLSQTVADTRLATRRMVERGVAMIAVLGGDGTHKAVAAEAADVPLLTLSTGELVRLDEQDRSLWDRQQIAEGALLVQRALSTRAFGPYALQAAIVAVHAEAPSAAQTDWTQIVRLYDVLLQFSPSAVVELNRAVAVAMRDGADAAMQLTGAVTAAVWAQERDIASPDVLAALLAECGLDAVRLDQSGQPEVQARYDAQTQAAIDASVFGAPSYVIDGELFWGQDRLDFVARQLRA